LALFGQTSLPAMLRGRRASSTARYLKIARDHDDGPLNHADDRGTTSWLIPRLKSCVPRPGANRCCRVQESEPAHRLFATQQRCLMAHAAAGAIFPQTRRWRRARGLPCRTLPSKLVARSPTTSQGRNTASAFLKGDAEIRPIARYVAGSEGKAGQPPVRARPRAVLMAHVSLAAACIWRRLDGLDGRRPERRALRARPALLGRDPALDRRVALIGSGPRFASLEGLSRCSPGSMKAGIVMDRLIIGLPAGL